jgi:hypothetical protein
LGALHGFDGDISHRWRAFHAFKGTVMSYRGIEPSDKDFQNVPRDQGGYFPGRIGDRNPPRSGMFSSTHQPKRRRKAKIPITNVAEIGADVLETMVPKIKNGRRRQVPLAELAVDRMAKFLMTGSRRDFTEAWKIFVSSGAINELQRRQAERHLAGDSRQQELDDLKIFQAKIDDMVASIARSSRQQAADIFSMIDEIKQSFGDQSNDKVEAALDVIRNWAKQILATETTPEPADSEDCEPAADAPKMAGSGHSVNAGPPITEDFWANASLVGSDDPSSPSQSTEPSEGIPSGIPTVDDLSSGEMKEGEVSFWVKKGKGYQQIRPKAGWIHGPRTRR